MISYNNLKISNGQHEIILSLGVVFMYDFVYITRSPNPFLGVFKSAFAIHSFFSKS